MRTPDELIEATTVLLSRLLRSKKRDVSDLREEGLALLDEIVEHMDAFARVNGPTVAYPATRAWYILREALEHATLLGVSS